MTNEASTYDEFADRVGETFDVASPSGPVGSLTLSECGPRTSGGGYSSYTLTFRGEKDAPLAQGTLAFSAPGLGPVYIFIVPTGTIDDGIQYEAVFNQKED